MAAGNAYIGNVATLTINSVTITNLKSITAPSMSVGSAEATPLGSTAVAKLPTIFDGGEFSFELWYDPVDTSHAGLETMLGSPSNVPIVLTVKGTGTSAHTFSFSGAIAGFDVSGFETTTPVVAAVKFNVSGAVTFV